MKYLYNFFIGILIGFGAILPGVSSGVFCVIFGIYEKLVDSIINFFKNIKDNICFLFPIGFGTIIGIVIFGNVVKFFFTKYNVFSCFVFIGLILGTIPALFKQASCSKYIHAKKIIPMVISFCIGISLILLEKKLGINSTISPIVSNPLYLILAGFLMSIGIVVPGISNTVILMCLGVYNEYINSISCFNLHTLIPIGIGVIIGGIIWLKLINFFLSKYHESTFYSIIGFTLGSIFVLYPGINFNMEGFICIILLLISVILSYKLSKY